MNLREHQLQSAFIGSIVLMLCIMILAILSKQFFTGIATILLFVVIYVLLRAEDKNEI